MADAHPHPRQRIYTTAAKVTKALNQTNGIKRGVRGTAEDRELTAFDAVADQSFKPVQRRFAVVFRPASRRLISQ